MNEKIEIDARVALQEATLKAQADDAYYKNRCLVLAQKLHEAELTIGRQLNEIDDLKNSISILSTQENE